MSEEAIVSTAPATVEAPPAPAVEIPSPAPTHVEPPAPPTAEELQKKFDRDAAMQRRTLKTQMR